MSEGDPERTRPLRCLPAQRFRIIKPPVSQSVSRPWPSFAAAAQSCTNHQSCSRSVSSVANLQASTNGGCQVHQVDDAASQRRAPRALPLDASSNPIDRPYSYHHVCLCEYVVVRPASSRTASLAKGGTTCSLTRNKAGEALHKSWAGP
ncbi:hypothetical protein LI328DRAFT_127321 [Trichoderma asperelloides]|nr:hypothetical protein LI328DRAFT_127321 [Trichoderma asperelloides]